MDRLNYVILNLAEPRRDGGADGRRLREGARGGLEGMFEAVRSERPPAVPVEGEVERHALSDREASDLRRDPRRLVSLDMPVTIVKPKTVRAGARNNPLTEAIAAKAAWGIAAVGADKTTATGAGVRV